MELTALVGLLHALESGEKSMTSHIVMMGVIVLVLVQFYKQMADAKKQTDAVKGVLAIAEETKAEITQELEATRKRLRNCERTQNELHDRIDELNQKLGACADKVRNSNDPQ